VSEHTVLYIGRYGRGVQINPDPKEVLYLQQEFVGVQPEHKVDNIEDTT